VEVLTVQKSNYIYKVYLSFFKLSRYCGAPFLYNIQIYHEELDIELLNFGFITFDNIFSSLFVLFHLMTI